MFVFIYTRKSILVAKVKLPQASYQEQQREREEREAGLLASNILRRTRQPQQRGDFTPSMDLAYVKSRACLRLIISTPEQGFCLCVSIAVIFLGWVMSPFLHAAGWQWPNLVRSCLLHRSLSSQWYCGSGASWPDLCWKSGETVKGRKYRKNCRNIILDKNG